MKQKHALLAALLAWNTAAAAGPISSVDSVSLSNPSPVPGESVTVSFSYTQADAFNNAKVLIAVSDQCALQPASTAGQTVVVGDSCLPDIQVSGGCDIPPDNQPAGSNLATRTIAIPNDLVPGNNYCVIVAMKNYGIYLNPGADIEAEACTCWSVPLPPPGITLTKRAEGTSAAPSGLVLFTINYTIANTNNAVIQDIVHPDLTIIQVNDGGSASGQTITWNFPGYIGPPQTGSVSFLAQVSGGVSAGSVLNNQATASSDDVSTVTSNLVAVSIDEVGLALEKSALPAIAAPGDTITYTIDYQTSGSTLEEYQNFDAGAVPAGWNVYGGPNPGTWSAASGYLEQSTSPIGGPSFPAMMAETMTTVHDAVYLMDWYLPATTDLGFDDLVFRFNSDATVNTFYMARMSVDTNELALDWTGGGTIASTASPNGYTLMHDTWYTLRVEVICGNIRMRTWPRNQPEPSSWAVDAVNATYSYDGIVGFQANNGSARFDNLKVFSLTGGTNVRLWDTVPAGTSYVGCSGGSACSESGGLVTWTVGGPCSNIGSVSMEVEVSASPCDPDIENQAGIDSDDPPPAVLSNTVVTTLNAPCNTPTPTSTATATQSPTASATASPSASPTSSQTATPSRTPTATPSATSTATPSASPTATASLTASSTPTVSATSTHTATASRTASATPTSTDSPTNTPGPSPTFTSTYSSTGTATLSATATATPSQSATASSTNTRTATPTQSSTLTQTPTSTTTVTSSQTASATPSFTASPIASPTATPSATPSYTASPTASSTPTVSQTSTYTATSSRTASATATPSTTSSLTVTLTRTVSPTVTTSYTVSATPTPPPPFSAKVEMFNSAGERIAVLHEAMGLADMPIAVEGPTQGFAPQDGQEALFLLVGSGKVLAWNGTNDQAQFVDSGSYTIKVTLTDQFGKVTTLQSSATALRSLEPVTVRVFNAAGEVVWSENSFGALPPTGVSLSRKQSVSDLPGPADREVTIQWGTGPGNQVVWDGRGAAGQVLDGGLYRVEVSSGPEHVYSAGLQVLRAGQAAPATQAFALAATAEIHVRAQPGTLLAKVLLYNLAGELVRQSSPATATTVIDASELASGIYLMKLEALSGDGSRQKATHKVAIIR